jgi:hypothetical protein
MSDACFDMDVTVVTCHVCARPFKAKTDDLSPRHWPTCSECKAYARLQNANRVVGVPQDMGDMNELNG